MDGMDGTQGDIGTFCGFPLHNLSHLGGRPEVIQQRLNAGKPMYANQFFVVQRTVGLSKLGVPFVGNFAQGIVVAHVRDSP